MNSKIYFFVLCAAYQLKNSHSYNKRICKYSVCTRIIYKGNFCVWNCFDPVITCLNKILSFRLLDSSEKFNHVFGSSRYKRIKHYAFLF